MFKKIIIGLVVFIAVFCLYVNSRPATFHYERSALINASSEKIFPYLNNFKLGNEWSPYAKVDPNMKSTFSGPESGVGAKMEFEGNTEVGSGRLEILKSEPNSYVQLRLEMLKPFQGTNIVEYKLAPEGTATRFTWSMSGEQIFLTKLIGVFLDCEKMVGDQFEKGIGNLKTIVEGK